VSAETTDVDDRVNILLVDDRPSNLLALQGILERPDYNLITALSGDEALAVVLREDVAVILLDIAMPGMDGFEVATIIKQRERYRHIPILFVTASVHHIEWIFKAYSVGAVDFLHKPLDPHAVRAKVAVFVELYRQKRQLREHAARLQEFERREHDIEVARLKFESERSYRHLAEAIPHVVWTADPRGELTYLNRRWFEITALDEAASLRSGWRAALHPEDAEHVDRQVDMAFTAGREFQHELRIRQRDGSYRWYLNRAVPERNAFGAIVRWVGTLVDIDAAKRAHDELQAALHLRDEFLSIASHELRTPLSALQLQLQGMQRLFEDVRAEALNDRVRKRLCDAVKQSERLAKLVDNLLDVARISRGKLELQVEEFDLVDAAREVVERFRDEALRHGGEIEVDAPERVLGRWDRLRMDQVITNLVSNSLKYGPGKPVRVRVKGGDGTAELAVEDEGIGIEAAKIERIFDRFERAAPVRRYGGLGLGLYIARQIVEAHGGRIEVQSNPGEGARFVITLPLRAVAERTAADAEP
jgi:PAS domain S-box-containing protein